MNPKRFLIPALWLLSGGVAADDLVEVRRLSMEMAHDIVRGAVEACRERGYQVTAVVVDRDGFDQMVMRDTLAPRFTCRSPERRQMPSFSPGSLQGRFATTARISAKR